MAELIFYLSSGINPHPGVAQLAEIRRQIEVDPVPGPGESHPAEEEDGEEEVGEESGEVDNLSSPFDSFPDAEVAEDPGNAQSANKLQSETASLVDLVGRFLILMKMLSIFSCSQCSCSPQPTVEEFSSPRIPQPDPSHSSGRD